MGEGARRAEEGKGEARKWEKLGRVQSKQRGEDSQESKWRRYQYTTDGEGGSGLGISSGDGLRSLWRVGWERGEALERGR